MDLLRIRERRVNLTTLIRMQSCTGKDIISHNLCNFLWSFANNFFPPGYLRFSFCISASSPHITKAFGNYTVSVRKEKGISCVWALQYNFQDASKIQWDVYAITWEFPPAFLLFTEHWVLEFWIGIWKLHLHTVTVCRRKW